MANRYESVAKLVRVRQGRATITFEQVDGDILIEYSTQKQSRPVRFTLKEKAVEALKELIGAAPAPGGKVIGLPDDGPGERPSGSTPREGHPEGKPVGDDAGPKGLQRQADGVVEGMG